MSWTPILMKKRAVDWKNKNRTKKSYITEKTYYRRRNR